MPGRVFRRKAAENASIYRHWLYGCGTLIISGTLKNSRSISNAGKGFQTQSG